MTLAAETHLLVARLIFVRTLVRVFVCVDPVWPACVITMRTSVFILGLPLPLLFGVMGLMLGWQPPSIMPQRLSSISSCSLPLCFL